MHAEDRLVRWSGYGTEDGPRRESQGECCSSLPSCLLFDRPSSDNDFRGDDAGTKHDGKDGFADTEDSINQKNLERAGNVGSKDEVVSPA